MKSRACLCREEEEKEKSQEVADPHPASSKGRWLETEVLDRGSVGWVIMKTIVHGSVSL